jgi:glucose dehydrogenase
MAWGQVDWPTYGGSDWNQRWSTLAQITTANVNRLVPRMMFQTGTSKLGSFENTPIVLDGTMFVTTPNSEAIIAYDLKAKRQLWRHEPKVGTVIACCGPVNRGAAVAGGKVFVGTLDGRVLALDTRNGAVKWEVEVGDPSAGYSITMAPLIVGENVIAGVSGGEYGIRGHLTAYNITTGKQAWRWY